MSGPLEGHGGVCDRSDCDPCSGYSGDHTCALDNGAPWLKAGDKVEVLTPVGWVLVEIRCTTDDPVKYPGYAHFDFGAHMHGCVSPYFYGTGWRLPAGHEMAVGL